MTPYLGIIVTVHKYHDIISMHGKIWQDVAADIISDWIRGDF